MYVQYFPGIYVYYLDCSLLFEKKINYYHFSNWNEFFLYFSSWKIISQFTNDPSKLWRNVSLEDRKDRYDCYRGKYLQSYFLAANEEGNPYFVSDILPRYNEWIKERQKLSNKRVHNRRHGRKPPAWGHYRTIKTFGSNRHDYVDEETGFEVQMRRKAVPPDSWDREAFSHNEKNWKKQSKRLHQWK